MYLFQKGKGTNEEYLTKAEKEMLERNANGYEAYLTKNSLKKDPHSLALYLNENSNHQKAVMTGDLVKQLKLEYSPENFAKLMKGENPLTKEQHKAIYGEKVKYREDGRLINNSKNSKQGEAMVLAMTRNFSIAYSLATPDRQRAMREAVNKADAIMTEDMKFYVKPTGQEKDGSHRYVLDWQVKENPEAYKDIPKNRIIDTSKTKLAFAEFWHYENREVEPHLHKHKQLMPVAEFTTMDGQTKMLSIDNSELYKHQKQLTSEFNTMLTQELSAIGIATESDKINGNDFAFRVSGITREQEKLVSDRQKELEEKASLSDKEYKPSSVKHLEYLLKEEIRNSTKKDKQGLNYDQVHSLIKGKSEEVLGKQGLKDYQDTQARLKGQRVLDQAKPVSTKGMKDFELNGVMTKQNLKAEIGNQLRFSGKNFTTLADLRSAVDTEYKKLLDSKEIVVMESGKIASKELIFNEMETLNKARKLNNSVERKVSFVKNENGITTKTYTYKNQQEIEKYNKFLDAYDKALPDKFKLFEGHKKGARAIHTNNPIIIVEGLGGTAKTKGLLAYTNKLFTSKEYEAERGKARIIGLSTQTKTAKALKDAGIEERMNCMKLCNTFYDFEKNEWKEKEFKKPENQNLKLILDEGGMVEAKLFNVMVGIVEKTRANGGDAQLIAVGHIDQLASVGAGNSWVDLNKIMTEDCKATLDQVVRHKTQETYSVAMSFLNKEPEKAIEVMKGAGWWNETKEGQTRDDLMNKLAEDYVNDKRDNKVAITFTNDDCSTLSDRIRSKLIEAQSNPKSHHYNDKNKIEVDKQVAIDVFKKGASKTTKDSEKKYFAPGDSIIITEQMPSIKGFDEKTNKYIAEKDGKTPITIATASIGTIKNIEADTNSKGNHILTVDFDGKEQKIFTALAENRTFTSSLAITTHSSQGITAESTYYLANKGTDANMAYVGFSRSEYEVKAYIEKDHIDGFIKTTKENGLKESTVYDKNCREVYFAEMTANNKEQEQVIDNLPPMIKNSLANGLELQAPVLNNTQELTKDLTQQVEMVKEIVIEAKKEELGLNQLNPRNETTIELDTNKVYQAEVKGEEVKKEQDNTLAFSTMSLMELRQELIKNPELYEQNSNYFKDHTYKEELAQFYMEGAGNNYITAEGMKKAFDTVKDNGLMTEEFIVSQVEKQNFPINYNDKFLKEYVAEAEINRLQAQENIVKNEAFNVEVDMAKLHENRFNFKEQDKIIAEIVEKQKVLEPNYIKGMSEELLNNKEIVDSLKDNISMGGLRFGSEQYFNLEKKLNTDNFKEVKEAYEKNEPNDTYMNDRLSRTLNDKLEVDRVKEEKRQAELKAEAERKEAERLAKELEAQKAKEYAEKLEAERQARAKADAQEAQQERGLVLTIKPASKGMSMR